MASRSVTSSRTTRLARKGQLLALIPDSARSRKRRSSTRLAARLTESVTRTYCRAPHLQQTHHLLHHQDNRELDISHHPLSARVLTPYSVEEPDEGRAAPRNVLASSLRSPPPSLTNTKEGLLPHNTHKSCGIIVSITLLERPPARLVHARS
jgi:hypothetical protein